MHGGGRCGYGCIIVYISVLLYSYIVYITNELVTPDLTVQAIVPQNEAYEIHLINFKLKCILF